MYQLIYFDYAKSLLDRVQFKNLNMAYEFIIDNRITEFQLINGSVVTSRWKTNGTDTQEV